MKKFLHYLGVIMWWLWQCRSKAATALSYMPGSFRPIPVDAAGELKGYFSEKAVTELEDLDAMMRKVKEQQRQQQHQQWNPSSSMYSTNNMNYDYFRSSTTSSPTIQQFYPQGQQDLMIQQQQQQQSSSSSSQDVHQVSLEERVKQLELQLAQLLKYGIPETSLQHSQELSAAVTAAAATTTTTTEMPQTNPTTTTTTSIDPATTMAASSTVQTFQGIPHSSIATPFSAMENTSQNNIMDNTMTSASTANNTPINPWDKLRNELERCQHMRGGTQSSSTSDNHHHTENTMGHWPSITRESHAAEDDQINKESSSFDNNFDHSISEDNTIITVHQTILDPRQLRLRQELERCQVMNRMELKQELEYRDINTHSLLEKSEFVRLLAHARVQEEEDDAAVEVKEAELVTDDSEPRSHDSNNGVYVQDEGEGSGMYTGGFCGQYGGMGSVVGCNGDGIPDMAKYGDGGGAHGGANPFVMAKVRECLANPAAFAKYYSDPDLVGIIRELRQQMV